MEPEELILQAIKQNNRQFNLDYSGLSEEGLELYRSLGLFDENREGHGTGWGLDGEVEEYTPSDIELGFDKPPFVRNYVNKTDEERLQRLENFNYMPPFRSMSGLGRRGELLYQLFKTTNLGRLLTEGGNRFLDEDPPGGPAWPPGSSPKFPDSWPTPEAKRDALREELDKIGVTEY